MNQPASYEPIELVASTDRDIICSYAVGAIEPTGTKVTTCSVPGCICIVGRFGSTRASQAYTHVLIASVYQALKRKQYCPMTHDPWKISLNKI